MPQYLYQPLSSLTCLSVPLIKMTYYSTCSRSRSLCFCSCPSLPFSSVQLLSHVRLFVTPIDCSTSGFPVHHQLPELAQTHVHRVGDPIQPSHPLSSPSAPVSLPFSPFLIQKPRRVRQIQPPLISHYCHIHNTSGISGHPVCGGFPTPSNSLRCQLGVPQFNSMKPGDHVRSHGVRTQSHETSLPLQMPISSGRFPGYLQLPFNLATKQRFPWPLPSWICLLEQLTELREILTYVYQCVKVYFKAFPWWTGRPGMLQSMGSQRVGHDLGTKQTTQTKPPSCYMDVVTNLEPLWHPSFRLHYIVMIDELTGQWWLIYL